MDRSRIEIHFSTYQALKKCCTAGARQRHNQPEAGLGREELDTGSVVINIFPYLNLNGCICCL